MIGIVIEKGSSIVRALHNEICAAISTVSLTIDCDDYYYCFKGLPYLQSTIEEPMFIIAHVLL
jgi:hypothetical protein